MQHSFHEVAASIGCIIGAVREDDRIHRCATELHPKKKNGSYRTDGLRGWIKNFETGETVTWREARPERRQAQRKPLPSLAKRRAEEERAARYAAEGARKRIAAATLATHVYLENKGFPKQRGLVHEGVLLIPARVGSDIVSLQQIYADRQKLNWTGGRMKGASFTIGSGQLEILCEGYATGLSIKAALDGLHLSARVICCFSASNVATVSEGHRRALVVADNDEPQEKLGGLGTGEFYARRSGLPWVMPPELRTDANDLHLARGLPALQALLLDLTQRKRKG